MKGAKRVRFKFPDFVVDIYTSAPRRGKSESGDGVDECTAAILKTLAEGRRPLTTTKLFAAMEARGHIFGEATIKRRLADAVKDGVLVSGSEGYALPEWGKT